MIWKPYSDSRNLDAILADKAYQYEKTGSVPVVNEQLNMHEENAHPLVSIGIPVYNGEDHLAEALEAVLCQSFDNFEVIISDNGSVDRTSDIARTYTRRDRRIIYHRNDYNRGAAYNFNLVFKRARGKYFKWLAHDDILDPHYLQYCVEVMGSCPDDVALVFPRRRFIDSQSRLIDECDYQPKRAISENGFPFREVYFSELVRLENQYYPAIVFGLMRTEVLRQTRLIGGYIASDLVLLAEVCLRGRVRQLQEYLYNQRVHRPSSWRANLDLKQEAAWFDPNNNYRSIRAPAFRLTVELLKAVAYSPNKLWHKAYYLSQAFMYPLCRVYKRVRDAIWSFWSWISFQGLALARYTSLPVRCWSAVRRLRKRGFKKASLWSTFVKEDKAELLSELSRAVISRKQPRCYRLMVHWLNSSNQACRKAAISALSTLKPEELDYINNYRIRLDEATADRLSDFIRHHEEERKGLGTSYRLRNSSRMRFNERGDI